MTLAYTAKLGLIIKTININMQKIYKMSIIEFLI